MNTKTEAALEEVFEMYLDWCNNFITVAYYAEYYRIPAYQAQDIINAGRNIHRVRCEAIC